MSWTPSDAYAVITRHYLLLSFGGSLGVLQIAAGLAGLRGIWLLPSAVATRWLGLAIITASVALFLIAPVWVEGPWAAGSAEADSATRQWGKAAWSELAGAYNVNDIHGGVSGTEQAVWFPMGFAMALAICLVSGALRAKRRGPAGDAETPDGLDGLKTHGYQSVLPRSWAVFRRELQSEIGREFDGRRHRYGLPARIARLWRRG